MLVLRLSADGLWGLEMAEPSQTLSLKKVRLAQTVRALLRNSSRTSDTFYPMLETAEQYGQPIWVDLKEVCAQGAAAA